MGLQNTSHFNMISRLPGEANRLDRILKAHRMRAIHAHEIPLVRALAADLLGLEPAPLSVMARVERWTHLTFFVRITDRKITGFLAVIPLTRSGHQALLTGKLTGCDIEKAWVAAPGQPFEAGLLWGMGGGTARDQTSILLALMAIWKKLYPSMPTYSRAATPLGLRLMRRLGYERILALPGQLELWGRYRFPSSDTRGKPKDVELVREVMQ